MTYPLWLYEERSAFPGGTHELWLCSGCDGPIWYRKPVNLRTMADYPDYYPALGPCWRSRQYKVKCVGPKTARITYRPTAQPPTPALLAELTRHARLQLRQRPSG